MARFPILQRAHCDLGQVPSPGQTSVSLSQMGLGQVTSECTHLLCFLGAINSMKERLAELSGCLGQGHTCLVRTLPLPTGDPSGPFLRSLPPHPKLLACWFPRHWHPKLELDSHRRGGESLRGQAGSPMAWLQPHLCHISSV